MMVVGVNGVGKTTTVGKLARVLVAEDKDVLLGAADTFRAAAAEQLATWGQRVGVPTVKSDIDGADPASVAYEAVKAGIDQEVDVVMIDTAGRLQNKVGLMDELGKVKRVIEKLAEVDEVLLVLDATTGQNGLNQARVFAEVVNITGIVLTKLDGTAKGGIVVAIQKSARRPGQADRPGRRRGRPRPVRRRELCGRAAELAASPCFRPAASCDVAGRSVSGVASQPADGQEQDPAGDAESPAVAQPVREQPGQDGADDRTDVGRHLEDRQYLAAGAAAADDIGDGGLLGRTEQAGTDAGHGGGGKEPWQVVGETDARGGQPRDEPARTSSWACVPANPPGGRRTSAQLHCRRKDGQGQPGRLGPAPKAATANSGTVAIRTPNVAQPLAKLEKSAAR